MNAFDWIVVKEEEVLFKVVDVFLVLVDQPVDVYAACGADDQVNPFVEPTPADHHTIVDFYFLVALNVWFNFG